jgi:hypothetical protein
LGLQPPEAKVAMEKAPKKKGIAQRFAEKIN